MSVSTGLIVPAYTRARYAAIMGMNSDKNYLTALELAAIADNHLVSLTVANLVEFLETKCDLPIRDEDMALIRRAIGLASYERDSAYV